MADDETLIRVRKRDLDSLLKHCSGCSSLSDDAQSALDRLQTSACSKRKPLPSSPSKSEPGTCKKRKSEPGTFKKRKSEISLPDPDQWKSLQQNLVGSREGYESLIRSLINTDSPKVREHKSLSLSLKTEHSLVTWGENIATCWHNSTQKAFASFRLFILLSYCLYLKYEGVPLSDIDAILNKLVTCNEKRRTQLLKRVAQLNAIIVEIACLPGWDVARATELFLICPITYTRLTEVKDADFEDIPARLSGEYDFSYCLRPSYTIPSFIMHLLQAGLQNGHSLERISRHLGYTAIVLPPVTHIHKVHAAVLFLDLTSRMKQENPSSPKVALIKEDAMNPLQVLKTLADENLAIVRILSLVHHFTLAGKPISKSLLVDGGGTKAEFSHEGALSEFDAQSVGLHAETVSILRNETVLQKALTLLHINGFIHWTPKENEYDEALISSNIAGTAEEDLVKAGDWTQAMILISFFFAGCEYSNKYQLHATYALPIFQALLSRYQARIDPVLAELVVPALLQASKFSTQLWKQQAIAIAETVGITDLPDHVRAYFAYRKSLILRTNRDSLGAEEAIYTYLSRRPVRVDSRLNAIHGYLQHSLAWLAVEKGSFNRAYGFVADWQVMPRDSKSYYEVRAMQRLITMKGIIKYHLRHFNAALMEFQAALGAYDTRSRVRQIVIAYMIDVSCELERFDHAQYLSTTELERIKLVPSKVTMKQFSDHYLREVLISSAELYVRRRDRKMANSLLQLLKKCFDATEIAVQVDQQRHVRVLILIAQDLHQDATTPEQWQAAHEAWVEVVAAAQKYHVLHINGWDYGLVCLSLHHAETMLGTTGVWLDRGVANFKVEDHFWRCGMQTHWLAYILENVHAIPHTTRARLTSLHEDTKEPVSGDAPTLVHVPPMPVPAPLY